MHRATALLLQLYREPASAATCAPGDWALLLGAMRRARCTGLFGVRLQQSGVLGMLPEPVQGQFEVARVVAAERGHLLAWELTEVARALASIDVPVVILKGAAYQMQRLPLAAGRLPGDLDVLVAGGALPRVEARLRAAGWASVAMAAYDERYYREWSHEIVPLRHPDRGIELDLHHAITPYLKGPGIDTAELLAAAVPAGFFRVLSPADQVIHCALHTFKDSDLAGRLREVMDFDLLIRSFGQRDPEAFSRALWLRAEQLGAVAALGLAARTARRWLATPVSPTAGARTAVPVVDAGKTRLLDRVMEGALDAAMLPGALHRPGLAAELARTLLLVRYHWLRMPAGRLVGHLARKAWMAVAGVAAWLKARALMSSQHGDPGYKP